mmetsp:Transcript_38547/g.80776  ORF Transcript_38547/g.80776 Transcript_38547/m.80776 type:complete len:830 (-) Transcript_38547:50-2539(-)
MPSYNSNDRSSSYEEKVPAGDFHSSRGSWEGNSKDFNETRQSRTFTTRCSTSSESDGDIPPPPPPDEFDDSSDYAGEDDASRRSCSINDENSLPSINFFEDESSAIQCVDSLNDQPKEGRAYCSNGKEPLGSCGYCIGYRSSPQKFVDSDSFDDRIKRDQSYCVKSNDNFHSGNSCVSNRSGSQKLIANDSFNDRSYKEPLYGRNYCVVNRISPQKPIPNERYHSDEKDSFEVDKRRYTGDCSYNDLVTREDGKSNASSEELRLDSLRLDYSDISTNSSRIGINCSAYSNRKSSKVSLDVIQCTQASAQLDPPESISNIDTDVSYPHLERDISDIGMTDTLESCLVVLKMFSLRCAFDHWRREMNYEGGNGFRLKDFSPIFRGIAPPCSGASAMRRYRQAFQNVTRFIQQATIRSTMVSWKNATLEARASMARRRFLEKQVFYSWRDLTVIAVGLRQRYFLMIVVNRWRLYAEECIDLRRKRYSALVHWATVKVVKAFTALKLHAKERKARKSETIRIGRCHGCIMTGGIDHVSTFVTPSNCESRRKWSNYAQDDKLESFKMSYRSPDASIAWNRTLNDTSRLSHYTKSNQMEQRYTNATGVTPRNTDYPVHHLASDWRGVDAQSRNNISRFSSSGSPFLQSRDFSTYLNSRQFSRLPSQKNPNHKFFGVDTMRGRGDHKDAFSIEPASIRASMCDVDVERHNPGPSSCNVSQPSSEDCLQDKRINVSSRFRSAHPADRYAFRSTPQYTHEKLDTKTLIRVTPKFQHEYSTHVPFSNTCKNVSVAPSVRSIRDYYQERFIVATVLDDVVSKVEQRYSTGFKSYNHSYFK